MRWLSGGELEQADNQSIEEEASQQAHRATKRRSEICEDAQRHTKRVPDIERRLFECGSD